MGRINYSTVVFVFLLLVVGCGGNEQNEGSNGGVIKETNEYDVIAIDSVEAQQQADDSEVASGQVSANVEEDAADDNPLRYIHPQGLFEMKFSDQWDGMFMPIEVGIRNEEAIDQSFESVIFEIVYDEVWQEGEAIFSIHIFDEVISVQEWYESERWINGWEYIGTADGRTFTLDYHYLEPSMFLTNEETFHEFEPLLNDIHNLIDDAFQVASGIEITAIDNNIYNEEEAKQYFSEKFSVEIGTVETLSLDLTNDDLEEMVLFNPVYPTDPQDWKSNVMVFNSEGSPLINTTMEMLRYPSNDILDIEVISHPTLGDSLGIYSGHRTYHMGVYGFEHHRFSYLDEFAEMVGIDFIDRNGDGAHDGVVVESVDYEESEGMAGSEIVEIHYDWNDEAGRWVQ
ncbi:hypothetical protein ACM26V_14985 [Salipaludibacillus sp. HK11]|uniref:hypothetical protein n=1 Tax=Salipaludibacillus sp. HK11 TaxID=3394320 RepID=UPI0039FC4D0C